MAAIISVEFKTPDVMTSMDGKSLISKMNRPQEFPSEFCKLKGTQMSCFKLLNIIIISSGKFFVLFCFVSVSRVCTTRCLREHNLKLVFEKSLKVF